MIGWLIFGGYIVVGFMRMRTYFERVHEYEKNEWPSMYTRERSNSTAFWCALGAASIWPLWEAQYWLRHIVLRQFSNDEYRLRQEDRIIEQATKILKERNGKVSS